MTLTKFIRASAVTIGALAVATQVNAADLYSGGGLKDAPVYAPAPMWTGFYFGAHAGADWSSVNVNHLTMDDGYGGSAGFGGGSLTSTGAIGGGQLGYNWQTSNFVLGLEVDLGAAGNTNERSFGLATYDPNAGTLNTVSKLNFLLWDDTTHCSRKVSSFWWEPLLGTLHFQPRRAIEGTNFADSVREFNQK